MDRNYSDHDDTGTETFKNTQISISKGHDTYRVEGRGGQLAAHTVDEVDTVTVNGAHSLTVDAISPTTFGDVNGPMLTVTVTDDEERRADISLPGDNA